jgi:hypothetical protein
MRSRENLNATVVSVLHCPSLPRALPLPSVPALTQQRYATARHVYQAQFVFQSQLADLGGRGMDTTDVRVPLDVRRQWVRSLQWRPLSVNEHRVQNNADLVDLMGFVRYVGRHTARPAPLLLDINIYYRMMKMCYGEKMLRWDVPYALRHHPPLFGCWHAYKHVLTVTFRRFHSLFVFLRHRTVPAGTTFPWAVPVRTMEYYVAALLLVSQVERLALNRRVTQLRRALAHQQGVVDALQPRISRRLLDVVQQQYEAIVAGTAMPGHTDLHRNRQLTRGRA